MANRVLVLGVGNTLFADDGAGIAAVRAASERWQGSGVDFAEAAAGGLELMDYLHGYAAAVVVDAAITGEARAGEFYLLDTDSLPALTRGGAHGAHLGTALQVAARMGLSMPRTLKVIGIEAAEITTLGEGLTPAVAQAIPVVAFAVVRLATELVQEVQLHA